MLSSRTWFAYGALAMVFLSSSLADSVVVLTNDNFHNEVGRDRSALVEFYAPRCGHCERLGPEYEKLGQSFKKTKSVLIGKVDCDEQKDLCTKYGFSGSPTIQWFPKGSLEPKKFEGAHTEDALVEFLNKEGGTNVKITAASSNVVELTPTNFNKVVDGKKCVLVEFYAPWCGPCKSLAPTYEKVATEFKSKKDIVIASVNGDAYKDLASRYGVKGYPTFKLFQKGKKTPEDYNGGRDFKDFVSFINKKCGTSKMGTEDLLQKLVLAI